MPVATQESNSKAANATADSGARRPVVACQQLTKTFKDFWMRDQAKAVDNLDLVVHESEIFGLLGPNGSGKSTTIKLILGLLKPTSGRVMVFDKSPSHVATKARIGYLPEESYLYPFLNARETLDYYGKLFRLDSKTRKKRIDELLEMVGLEHAQHRPVREYSKGMQRRIGIAQALINDPDLLILDEPTTGLDPIGTRQVKDLILQLGQRGKSIILSSHLLTDVEDVVDRMVILYGGKIRGEGTCDDLLSSKERTSIETDELDDATIAEIDEVIRRRSSGSKSILSVSSPRQKLEELFMGIVERAQAERTSTSGVTQGGQTPEFLRSATAPIAGDALIDSLLESESESDDDSSPVDSTEDQGSGSSDQRAEPAPAAPVPDDDGVISSLMEDSQADDQLPPQAELLEHSDDGHKGLADVSGRGAQDDVDVGIIDSLLDPDSKTGSKADSKAGSKTDPKTDGENNQ